MVLEVFPAVDDDHDVGTGCGLGQQAGGGSSLDFLGEPGDEASDAVRFGGGEGAAAVGQVAVVGQSGGSGMGR